MNVYNVRLLVTLWFCCPCWDWQAHTGPGANAVFFFFHRELYYITLLGRSLLENNNFHDMTNYKTILKLAYQYFNIHMYDVYLKKKTFLLL